METTTITNLTEMEIPCILNRASLGNANYVFAVLVDLSDIQQKVAWVPREDITIIDQPLTGEQLNAKLRVKIIEEKQEQYIVSVINDGKEEQVTIAK